MNGLALCAGVGGLELGIKLAAPGYRTICYVEGEAYAAAILAQRMEDGLLEPAPIYGDVATFDGLPWAGAVDIVTAGFPCQPWSQAGRGEGEQDERWIWPDIARILRDVEPGWVFLENVPPIVSRGGVARVLRDLAILGFDAEWSMFTASASGAPHLRRRWFLLATDASGDELRKKQRRAEPGRARAPELGDDGPDGDVADADRPRLEGRERGKLPECPGQWSAGSSRGSGYPWWRTEPDVGRVADGVPYRVDRLRALGNGVVPAVAARAFTELYRRLMA